MEAIPYNLGYKAMVFHHVARSDDIIGRGFIRKPGVVSYIRGSIHSSIHAAKQAYFYLYIAVARRYFSD